MAVFAALGADLFAAFAEVLVGVAVAILAPFSGDKLPAFDDDQPFIDSVEEFVIDLGLNFGHFLLCDDFHTVGLRHETLDPDRI